MHRSHQSQACWHRIDFHRYCCRSRRCLYWQYYQKHRLSHRMCRLCSCCRQRARHRCYLWLRRRLALAQRDCSGSGYCCCYCSPPKPPNVEPVLVLLLLLLPKKDIFAVSRGRSVRGR
ncbi:hypothetical protein BAUCODRAFT_403494 [Baudoinia panamericana UAMH 10762]|uniref:Uncharacterized protein n=1 Tax=Baudoinia panamericana (strain UAMH 10762) TaxID=717646 RepID=M2NEU3_BAUPA|nr:uncharacterized protein BAUCODRAFT_403494 [Baudoinia panamericana UAMH 10762]EMC97774.1 hypothetical protein BAUCODRAFT_403494 [Baudoinia panamericana UAMH 10762]